MEQTVRIGLASNATVITNQGNTGVILPHLEIWAKDNVQATLLREICGQPKTVDELKQVAQGIRGDPVGDAFDALALVDFIVTFGNAIEHRESNPT